MGKYTFSSSREQKAKDTDRPHSVWNGLGCLMMVVVPVMSIAGAILTVQFGLSAGWPFPAVLLRHITAPDWIYFMPGLARLLLKVFSVNYLLAYIYISVIYIVVLGGLMSILYAILYRMTAPSQYGPMDAPPIKKKAKQYKR
jgi:hypothetical protein